MDRCWSETSHSFQLEPKAVGQFCVASRSSDGTWDRAVIEAEHTMEYEVRFVDHGDTEMIHSGKLKKLFAKFTTQPRFAIR